MPKDPELAVRTFAALAAGEPDVPWTLEVVGSGTLRPAVEELIAGLPPDVAGRITLRGRLSAARPTEYRDSDGGDQCAGQAVHVSPFASGRRESGLVP